VIRGKGCKPSDAHKLAYRLLAPDVGSIPPSADLSKYQPQILDQGPTGACTAHATAAAIYTAYEGTLTWVPSPKSIYAITRGLERGVATIAGGTLPPLSDSGAMLADVFQAVREFGVCPMGTSVEGRNSDCDASNVLTEPSIADLEVANSRPILGPYKSDLQQPATLAQAISLGFPVVVAFFCDTTFENLQAGQVAGKPNMSDTQGGGHAVYLSGYTINAAGNYTFTLTNSWGEGWCDKGKCLVGQDWLDAAWEAWPCVPH